MQELHKKRIEVAINIWGEILEGSFSSRSEIVRFVREVYEENRLEPIRGKTKIDIYDKELATIYLVGKYGLGLDEELERYSHLFSIELKSDKVIERVLQGDSPRKSMLEVFGTLDENMVFRVLRLAMTAVILGFMPEERFIAVLTSFEKEFPELDKNIQGFKRFYIAYRLAEEIAAGKVRNRIEKETLKHAMCVRLNAERAAPPDRFIREIAVEALRIPEHKVNSALSLSD
ncbi:DUF2192 domain-containing protein [Infirmifilum sp. NZ]|uniref:DUF2192 domain-containing protein n=1 Tax=Infirmifilum sp. NZ TaxID=2926850 RepID=UPI0027A8920A|nr:DUF2192 domain-containing protein [Infirmifilum sp. NZ]UNQ72565.1 DUF2192 domain-containing protein [Infirmifilum sp. NZ]